MPTPFMWISRPQPRAKTAKDLRPAYNFIEFMPTFKDYLYTQICGINAIYAKKESEWNKNTYPKGTFPDPWMGVFCD